MHTVIIIPARFGSKRFPGKPLHLLHGKSMIQRVFELAKTAQQTMQDVDVIVATDHEKIIEHVESFGGTAVMTPPECPSGSDRCLAAIQALNRDPDYVLNLQGDAPLTPLSVIKAMLSTLQSTSFEVLTPVVQLTWDDLEQYRQSKITRPFSGTTAIINDADEAIWFSKQILPAIRDEQTLKATTSLSPVFKHIGLYGFKRSVLEAFTQLPKSHYESVEGLEQLRLLENGYHIQTLRFSSDVLPDFQGVDTLEDAQEIERILIA